MDFQHIRNHNDIGQSLTEYALCISLVILASLGGLLLLGKNVNSLVQNLLPAKPVSAAAATTGPTIAAIPPTTASAPVSTPGIIISGSQVTMTTANGTQITLKNYPSNLSTSVATAGANGTTALLADSLTSTANQLLAAGNIDQSQYNALMALANQGHNMAQLQQLIENAAQTAKNPTAFQNTVLTYNGQTTTVGSLYSTLGFRGGSPGAVADPLTDTRAETQMQTLQSLYQTASSSGALSDPAVMQLVTGLTSQIGLVSNDLHWSVQNTWDGTGTSLTSVASQAASYLNNESSAGICAAGTGTDTGVQCSV